MLQPRTANVWIAADSLTLARAVFATEAAALMEVSARLGDDFAQAAQMLFECRGNVIVTGMGKSGHIGVKIAATLTSTGTVSFFLHPAEAVHGDLGRVTSADVVVAMSDSGESAELTQILPRIKDIGASIIGVTGRSTGTLAKASDIAIIYGRLTEACPLKLAPMTSTTVMLAIGDALAAVLVRMRGFTEEDFGAFHPHGTLGRKLRTVDEVMRTADQLRIADSSLPVRDVFVNVQRPGRRTGAIMLIDAEGRLEGLFTDSDLARLLERRDLGIFQQPIREVMTKKPITLHSGQRVKEAMHLLRHHHVSEIPVLDDEGRPIGLVDLTDLVDLLPDAA